MRFELVDRVLELEPGKRIVTVKAVSLAEEYLADHFPTFPVMPGVLMLETLVESARWLVQVTQDFACSLVLLREARNVTYRSFVKPGRLLRGEVTCRRMTAETSDFQGVGSCGGVEVVQARFGLRHVNLAERAAELSAVDNRLVASARQRWALLNGAVAG